LCLAPPNLPDHVLPSAQQSPHNRILMCRWDGTTLHHSQRETLITSSSKHFDAVVQARDHSAHSLREPHQHNPDNAPLTAARRRALHREFHHSHGDSRSAMSVCMHRSDARTVSYSEISVGPGFARFDYYAGSPCETDSAIHNELRWVV